MIANLKSITLPLVSGNHKVKTPATKLKSAKMTIVAVGEILPSSLPTIGASIDPIRPKILAVAKPVDVVITVVEFQSVN